MPNYQGRTRTCPTKDAVVTLVGPPKGGTGLQSGGFAKKSKLLGNCFAPDFDSKNLAKATLVGFGPKKDEVKTETYNKVLVPHIEEAFRRIKKLNLSYELRTINGHQFRYAKTDKNREALKDRPEYAKIRSLPSFGGSWNTLCARLDQAEDRFDEKVAGRGGLPKRDILSNHSYGSAFDLNARENPFKNTLAFDVPLEIVHLLENMGFYWGGRYHDYMHFEWVDSSPPKGSTITIQSQVCWPLKANVAPQSPAKYFAMNESGNGGYFPIGLRQNLHGGVHLDPFMPSKLANGAIVQPAWNSGTCPVSSFLPGYIVAARCFPEPGWNDPRLLEATEQRPLGFVLVRHEALVPAPPREGDPPPTPAKADALYSLYMHLDPPGGTPDAPKAAAGVEWLEKLLGMQHGCVVNLDPTVKDVPVGRVNWLDKPAAPEAAEVAVRGQKQPFKLRAADGQSLGFVKPCPEEVRDAVEAFQRGAVITLDAPLLPVAAGDVLGFISPKGAAGYLHWEVFSLVGEGSALDLIAEKASGLGFSFVEVSEKVPDNFIEMPDETGAGSNELKPMFKDTNLDVMAELSDQRYPAALRRWMLEPAKFGPGSKVGRSGAAVYPVALELKHAAAVPLKANNDGSPYKLDVHFLRGGENLAQETVTVSPSQTTLTIEVPVEADELSLWSSDLFLDPPPAPTTDEQAKNDFNARCEHLQQVLGGRTRNIILKHVNEWTPEGLEKQLDARMKAQKLANVLALGDANLKELARVFRPITWWGRVRSDEDPAGEVPLVGKNNGKVESLFGGSVEAHQLPPDATVQCMHPVACAAVTDLLLEKQLIAFTSAWGPVPLRQGDDLTKPPLLALVWVSKQSALGAKAVAVLIQHGYGSSGNTLAESVTFKLEREDAAGETTIASSPYDQGVATAEMHLERWGTWRLSAWHAGQKLMPAQEKAVAINVPKPEILDGSVQWHPSLDHPGQYVVSMIIKGSRPNKLKGYAVLDWAKTTGEAPANDVPFTPGDIAVPVVFETSDADQERVSAGLRYKGDYLVGRAKPKENPAVSKSFRFLDFIKTKTGQKVFAEDEAVFRLMLPLIDRLEQLKRLCDGTAGSGKVGFRVSSLSTRGEALVITPAIPSLFAKLCDALEKLPSSSLFEVEVNHSSTTATILCLLGETDAVARCTVSLASDVGIIGADKLTGAGETLHVRPSIAFPNGGLVCGGGEAGGIRTTKSTIENVSQQDCVTPSSLFILPPVRHFEFGEVKLSFGQSSLCAEVELLGDPTLWNRAKPMFKLELEGKEISGGSFKQSRLVKEWPLWKASQGPGSKLGQTYKVTAGVSCPAVLAVVPPPVAASIKLEPKLETFSFKTTRSHLVLEGKATAMPKNQALEVTVQVADDLGEWLETQVAMVYETQSRDRRAVCSASGKFYAKVSLAALDGNRSYKFTWHPTGDGDSSPKLEPRSVVVQPSDRSAPK